MTNKDKDNEDQDHDNEQDGKDNRSTYVGRDNVHDVPSAGKAAGLNHAFPHSSPILIVFVDLPSYHYNVNERLS